MNVSVFRPAVLAIAGAACAFACQAASLGSSASSAASESVGSVSDSLGASSNSSSGDRRVAEGDYRVVEVAAVAERADRVRLTLRLVAQGQPADDVLLELPRQALGERGMAPGALVHASHRPYGYEFARVETKEPFYLVLTDDWRRELDARPVTL